MAKMPIKLTVNGRAVEALAEPRTLLIHFLREELRLTGPHIGCDTSHCGACTVDLDGKSVKSCTVFVAQANGGTLRTIEGMAAADGALHPLQEAFREHHGLQCGFCTPGMITRAYRLLQENPDPTEAENPPGHCRQSLPLHRLPEHRQGDPRRRGAHEQHQGGRRMSAAADTVARKQKLEGLGTSRKRVEDARFTQGKGNYVDDIKLPNMLFGDFVRSQYGHARIKSIKKEAALALPGVKAVITAADLKPLKLDYMPTLAGDVQAVLAGDKVLFQGQEIAFVVAEDRYIAADAVELVEVEYEELPAIVDPNQSMAANAPVLREDLAGKTEGAHGKRKHANHIFTWETGDAQGTANVLASAEVVAKELIVYQRVHPCPIETCGCVASMDKINGHLTVWGTFQAPHAVRTVASLISGIPEHKIRIISPDIGGGFGNKVGVYPGYICSIVASIVTGVPVKWIEDRMENLIATAFARDYHMTGEIAATKDGRITALRCHVLADHGAFDACADPTKYPAGFFNICTGSYDIPVAHLTVDGVYTNKAPGGVAYRCSFRVTEASYFIERMVDVLARKLALDPAEIRRRNLIKKEQFPYRSALGWEYDSGDYHTALDKALKAVDYAGLREEQRKNRGAFQRGETRTLMGIRRRLLHRDRGRGPDEELRHSRLGHVRQLRNPRPPDGERHRAARHHQPRPRPRHDLRADPGERDRHSRRQHHRRGGRHRHRALWARHLWLALDARRGRRHRHGGPQDPRQGADDRGISPRGA